MQAIQQVASNTLPNIGPRIIEVNVGHFHDNHFICLDDLETWRKNQSTDSELYSTFFRYFTEDPEVGGVLASFIMDFDSETDVKKAQSEAMTTIKYLKDQYDIHEEDFSIAFSGNKGFHVVVDHDIFGIEPYFDLPKIFKSMAVELKKIHNLKTIDLTIYERTRFIRLPNSKHGKSGFYKIPLSFTELVNLNIDKIKLLAVKPKPTFKHVEHPENVNAREWFHRHKYDFEEKMKDKPQDFDEKQLISVDLPCVKKRLELGAEEGMGHKYTWQLASYFYRKKMPEEQCILLLHQWFNRLSHVETRSWEACEKTIRYVYEKHSYHIGCNSEFIYDLCMGKEKCPLFTEKPSPQVFTQDILTKAEEILAGTPLTFITKTVQQKHVGDAQSIQMAYGSSLSPKICRNSINIWPIGTTQKGKSHLLKTVTYTLPPGHFEVFTSASPQSLFYYAKKNGENAFDGKVIFIDEVESSKFAIPMLRSLTGQTDIEPRHLSVHEAELLDLKIKGRRTVWFTSVKSIGDDQIRNRFIFINPDESPAQDETVFQLQDTIYRIGKQTPNKDFEVAQAITKKIIEATEKLEVTIPFEIIWPYKTYRMLYPIFLAFIEAVTKINFKNRQIKDTTIEATQHDFEKVKAFWRANHEQIIYRVSTPTKKILEQLSDSITKAKTKVTIAEEIDYSTKQVGRLLQELLDAGLINAQKQEHGRAWMYWKASLPSVEDIKINWDKKTSDMGHLLSGIEKNVVKSEASQNDVPLVHVPDVPAENQNKNVLVVPVTHVEYNGPYCKDCVWWGIPGECLQNPESPEMILPTAEYPKTCAKFQPKGREGRGSE